MALIDLFRDEDLFPATFQSFLGTDLARSVARGTVMPAVNIGETEDGAYIIDVAAPGLTKDDFKLAIDGRVLTISSEKKEEKEEKGKRFSRKEFSLSKFSRSFSLPDDVADDNIAASYENGILKIKLPRRQLPSRESKQIPIK